MPAWKSEVYGKVRRFVKIGQRISPPCDYRLTQLRDNDLYGKDYRRRRKWTLKITLKTRA